MHLVSHDSVSMATQGLIHANNNQKHPLYSGLGWVVCWGWVGGSQWTNGLHVPPLWLGHDFQRQHCEAVAAARKPVIAKVFNVAQIRCDQLQSQAEIKSETREITLSQTYNSTGRKCFRECTWWANVGGFSEDGQEISGVLTKMTGNPGDSLLQMSCRSSSCRTSYPSNLHSPSTFLLHWYSHVAALAHSVSSVVHSKFASAKLTPPVLILTPTEHLYASTL